MSKKTQLFKLLSLCISIVLIAVTALIVVSCGQQESGADSQTVSSETANEDAVSIGEGSKQFDFTVIFPDGSEHAYNVSTDEETVGGALMGVGLISGDEGAYGLYVKTVDGVTLDYDTDKKFWSFCIDGNMAPTGADTTAIETGKTYSFKAEQ